VGNQAQTNSMQPFFRSKPFRLIPATATLRFTRTARQVIARWDGTALTAYGKRANGSIGEKTPIQANLRNVMAAKDKKCAHPPCSCAASGDSKYCSTECQAMEKTPDINCLCHHAGCKGKIA